MELGSLLGWIAIGALAVLVSGWLYTSFRPPGPRRSVVEWVAATALFLVLACFFGSLAWRAIAEESHLASFAFGFLSLFFCAGLVVSLTRTVGRLRGDKKEGVSATN